MTLLLFLIIQLRNFCLYNFDSKTLGLVDLKALVRKGQILSPDNPVTVPLNRKLTLPPRLYEVFRPLSQQLERGSLYWLG